MIPRVIIGALKTLRKHGYEVEADATDEGQPYISICHPDGGVFYLTPSDWRNDEMGQEVHRAVLGKAWAATAMM